MVIDSTWPMAADGSQNTRPGGVLQATVCCGKPQDPESEREDSL